MKFKDVYKKIGFSKQCWTCKHYKYLASKCSKFKIHVTGEDYCRLGYCRNNTRLLEDIQRCRKKNEATIIKKKIGFKDWRDR